MRPSPAPTSALRRHLSLAAAACVALPATLLQARERLRPTPSQTEGPFYPTELPADHDGDLLRTGSASYALGEPAWVEGSVRAVDGEALAGAWVEIWQCDAQGRYHHPAERGRADPAFQGFGRVSTDAQGRYRFRTIRPAPYSGRTPHIHLKVRLGKHELLTTQLYVQGDPGNERDFLWRRLSPRDQQALTVPFVRRGDAWRADFPLVVEA
ncbi:MAG: hypothetical protein RL014_424 [Pseudomonadota bacterium]